MMYVNLSPLKKFTFKLTGGISVEQRGKSENKFYAAMRDKEAIENERKNLSRNLELVINYETITYSELRSPFWLAQTILSYQ